MEEWDPFADPADTGSEIAQCIQDSDANSIFSTRWTDEVKDNAIVAALLGSPGGDPILRSQEEESPRHEEGHKIHGMPDKPRDEKRFIQVGECRQLAGEEPKVVNGSSPNPCRVAAERPVYRNKGVGKGKHGGKNAGHAAWLLGLDEPPEPLREPMHPPTEPAEQAELPAPEPVSKPEQVSVTQGRQHEESAVESRTEESSVESKEHEETRMICEIDPARL